MPRKPADPLDPPPVIEVSPEDFEQIKKEIDRPPRKSKRLTKLLRTKAPWEN